MGCTEGVALTFAYRMLGLSSRKSLGTSSVLQWLWNLHDLLHFLHTSGRSNPLNPRGSRGRTWRERVGGAVGLGLSHRRRLRQRPCLRPLRYGGDYELGRTVGCTARPYWRELALRELRGVQDGVPEGIEAS